MDDATNLRIPVESALKEAGRFFGEWSSAWETAVEKGRANYVTQIDYKVQEYLVSALNSIIPGSNIITEENEKNDLSLSKPTWILDPVDGTTNLFHGYQHSAVSLALYTGGKAAAGWIYNPTSGEMFSGEAGRGAWLDGRKINVSGNRLIGDCLISFGTTPYDRSNADKTFDILKRVFMKCQEVRRSGSAALDLAYVACGRTDGFFELRLQPWDFAAGILILEEAGGRITDWEGKRPGAVSPSSILATNGLVHDELFELLRLV